MIIASILITLGAFVCLLPVYLEVNSRYSTNIFICIVVGAILIVSGGCVIMDTKEQLSRYEDYKSKCEILLDSIAVWDDSFLDTVCETDTYQDYIEAREKLNN